MIQCNIRRKWSARADPRALLFGASGDDHVVDNIYCVRPFAGRRESRRYPPTEVFA